MEHDPSYSDHTISSGQSSDLVVDGCDFSKIAEYLEAREERFAKEHIKQEIEKSKKEIEVSQNYIRKLKILESQERRKKSRQEKSLLEQIKIQKNKAEQIRKNSIQLLLNSDKGE